MGPLRRLVWLCALPLFAALAIVGLPPPQIIRPHPLQQHQEETVRLER
ncbi:hypothetical protein JQ557_28505 [Bradyrhizobium sp. U87765 SZCCT0131]|nr:MULTISPECIES: hypothetical protein [unclassified Bradyrhizobium]MBR1221975.1 hypothetical protein [Bradyrhizobium sp. U87765 SZCCT0131]MBR1263827.1 hypothetical protein [Bradyrhizobium sp. U87765 SZCCT0134]MBR1302603.1 hypothetical protein [Bradyrhizobium sp. U87765 SZCCT0110]MBR1320077.1 hypothetical protein [Bradyrhizobium sp. U87765 SZCCT0109]MBR1348810.1 hypothetical protein [Bradyrhizobium sp. U87765 SZCCT0048]